MRILFQVLQYFNLQLVWKTISIFVKIYVSWLPLANKSILSQGEQWNFDGFHLFTRGIFDEHLVLLSLWTQTRGLEWSGHPFLLFGGTHSLMSKSMNLSKLWGIMEDKGSLVCYNPWGCKESNKTKHLNNNNNVVETVAVFYCSRNK